MSLILEKCIEFNDNRKVCVASENGKTYRLENISGFIVRKVLVDKCLPQNHREKRCDFLMEIKDLRRVIFIELKGGGLTEALKQIYSSIIYLKEEFKNYQINARIIGSRDVPGFINTPSYVKLTKEIKSNENLEGTIERATNNIYLEKI